jgi:hypothetical protein
MKGFGKHLLIAGDVNEFSHAVENGRTATADAQMLFYFYA